jgi:hypothetical protein
LPSWLTTQPMHAQSSAGAWNHPIIPPPTLPSLSLHDNQQSAPLTRISEHPQTTLQSGTDQAPLLTLRSGDGSTQINPHELQRRLTQPMHIVSCHRYSRYNRPNSNISIDVWSSGRYSRGLYLPLYMHANS